MAPPVDADFRLRRCFGHICRAATHRGKSCALPLPCSSDLRCSPSRRRRGANAAGTGSASRQPPAGDAVAARRTKARSSSPPRSARRRVQEVPFSINAQTQADIQRANAQTIEDISRNVAGLTVQNLGPGQSQVSVRGVSAGQIARDQPGVKEQVGIYLDETITSLSLFTPDFDLFDLNRVETLRGPQGTLVRRRQRRRHHPLHHQPAEGGPGRRHGRSGRRES